VDDRIESLVRQMTVVEKVSLLAGSDQWHTVPVERLGIPAIKLTDGPNGARGSQGRGGPSSACFPVGVALGATWNTGLVERVGAALADEVQSKAAHMLLAPTVNIQRSPLAGRNFECYSEDPYLSGRVATAYIQGLQGKGVGACIKHFVCNESEFERRSMSSEVPERALREIYLEPFRMALREARPWAVMSAYNKLNGTWCSENDRLLLEILKGEWAFDGIVISDWLGTYSPQAALGGLDLEMPGPARWMGVPAVQAIEAGHLSEAALDDKVRRLLRTITRAGAFEQPDRGPEQAIDRPEHRLLAREAATEAMVLLKNRDLLPLDADRIRSIAVIGENALRPAVLGGGSSHVRPHYVVSPLEGIRQRAGDRVCVGYELGCAVRRFLPLIDQDWLAAADADRKGLTLQVYANPDLSGAPIRTEVVSTTDLQWNPTNMPGLDTSSFSVRLSGDFTAPQTSLFHFGLRGTGLYRLSIDGQVLLDAWASPISEHERTAVVQMVAGQRCRLVVEGRFVTEHHWHGLRLGCEPPVPTGSIASAAALAARSDVAVVLAGLTAEWESEDFDRPDMELPGRQVELIEAVAAANPNTVVVLNIGSPIHMPWLDRVAAVLLAWYPGQEAGNAIADVLFGDVDPGGRLPTTFPKRLQDNPAYINYPGENGEVLYGEGIWVGYRYYDRKEVEPLFPFGFGLSYTGFAYRSLSLSAPEIVQGESVLVRVEIENTGRRSGSEVVQLYVHDVESRLSRPDKELKAFAKVALAPGEARPVSFTLDASALSFYDPAQRSWVAEPGEFGVWWAATRATSACKGTSH
jgi:beta-glucosidase